MNIASTAATTEKRMADISQDNARYIDEAVKLGTYSDENEALNEAVSLLKRRDQLRAEVHAGIVQADAGELLPAEKVFERLERRAREIEEAAPEQ
jgi:Arc/MetJ-type ribon-helix-helix transcriptional regulator